MGVHHLPSTWMCSPIGNTPNPILLGFIEVSSHRHEQRLTPLPAPLFSLEKQGLGLKIPSFFLWLGLSGNQSPTRSHPGAHPERPQQSKSCSDHLGVYKEFRSLCQGLGTKRKYIVHVINHDITATFLCVPYNWELCHRIKLRPTRCRQKLDVQLPRLKGAEASLTFPCSFPLHPRPRNAYSRGPSRQMAE